MAKMSETRKAQKVADKAAKKNAPIRDLIKNRKATHDYIVVSAYEAGIELRGTEVKSCRAGNIALVDSYARILGGELILIGAHIAPYDFGNIHNHPPTRQRRLLLHKREIRKIAAQIREKGYTLIPLRFYLKYGKIKVELGLCKGKNTGDKRQTLRNKEHERETRRAIAAHMKG